MKEYLTPYRSVRLREALGFALFLAWVYCSLFGCGLASYENSPVGVTTVYNLEHLWMVSGLLEAIAGLAGVLFARLHPTADKLLASRRFGATALFCAVSGNIIMWYAWAHFPGAFWQLYPLGGGLAGVAIALFTALWSVRLGTRDETCVELTIPLSFAIAFALYFVLLLTKQGSIPILIALIIMASASTIFAFWDKRTFPLPLSQPAQSKGDQEKEGLLSFSILVLASWVQVAFFRIISTPELQGDRFTHFLLPFSFACILSVVMLALCIRMSRYLNISLAYRWSLPLFMLSYLPIFADYDNATLRMIAYAINFLGMFGVQFGCWVGACKHLRRSKCGAIHLFGAYALGEGMGIFVGCIIGLNVMSTTDAHGMMEVSIILTTVVLFAVMVTGFNPNWVFHRATLTETSGTGKTVPDDRGTNIETLCRQEADHLQGTYGLTSREADVAALLLAGRSRPYIRDELTVSINTVSSHVRKIFFKCGVHSQQELIDLARGRHKDIV